MRAQGSIKKCVLCKYLLTEAFWPFPGGLLVIVGTLNKSDSSSRLYTVMGSSFVVCMES